MALPFQRPAAAVAPGHAAVIRVPRSVPLAPRGTATARPLVPPWLVPARSGIGSAYAAAKRKP